MRSNSRSRSASGAAYSSAPESATGGATAALLEYASVRPHTQLRGWPPLFWACFSLIACSFALSAYLLIARRPLPSADDLALELISQDGVYDTSRACSKGAMAWDLCGANGGVCGYGLACVATRLRTGAICVPVCQEAWLADAVTQRDVDTRLYNAGCMVDASTDTHVDVGNVATTAFNIAVPDCDVPGDNMSADEIGPREEVLLEMQALANSTDAIAPMPASKADQW